MAELVVKKLDMIKRNNKAEVIWQKLQGNSHFRELIAQTRLLLSVPQNGFKDEKEEGKWVKKMRADKKRFKQLVSFEYETENYDWGYEVSGMSDVIYEYLRYDKVNKSTLLRANTTFCELFVMSSDNKDWVKKQMTEGVYIKVGHKSRDVDIKLFLNQQRFLIKAMQKLFLGNQVVTATKYKKSKNEERDYWVELLGSLNSAKLKEFGGGGSTYKSIQIANILNKTSKTKITEENVRQIIHRQRKKRLPVTNKKTL